MRKVLKWVGIGIGVLVGVVIAAAVLLYFMGGTRLSKTRQVQPLAIAIHNDEAALARGEHLVKAACASCHSDDLSGTAFLADPAIGTIYAANITGLGERRTDEELVLAIRHGIGPGGRQLVIMPSESFIHFSEEDLNAVIAYLKTVPRTGEDTPEPKLAPLGQIMLAAGMFGQVFPAEYIDHDQPFNEMPEISANREYGEYLSRFCTSCHGEDLSGKASGDPNGPFAPNLTPGGGLANWTEDDFIQTIRTGVNPYNYHLDPDFMPWKSFAKFEDEELQAIWIYLKSMPAITTELE
ncbi:MAG: c-type cytochrome [Chloroflexota bacterium]|nr:MAG: c-type cytochrome [Chloroflexota bacterium]